MMKKALTVAAVTLAASMAFAQVSTLQVSQVTRNAVNQLLNTNLLDTNTKQAANAVSNTASDSVVATGADAVMTGHKVKMGVISAGQFVTQDTAMPIYNKVLTPTGHAALKAVHFMTNTLPNDVSVAATNVVATIEFSANATGVGATAMGLATKADATALANTKPAETNLAGTGKGVSNAATVGATTVDSQASGAFSSHPIDKIQAYKRRKALERQQLVHSMAAEWAPIIIKQGLQSPDSTAELELLGNYAAQLSNQTVTADAAFAIGAAYVKAAIMTGRNG